MADISKITLPSGNTYDIKDAGARELISQLTGISLIVAWNGSSTPVVANIPAGVVVTYNGTDYTGTLAANSATAGAFYLVHSTSSSVEMDVYDEYVAIGAAGSKSWERIGSTSIDLSALGALAYKDSVSLNKGSGDKVLGSDATFTTTVTPATTNIKATASGTAVGADGTANAITGLGTPTTAQFLSASSTIAQKVLVTDTVPNVTSAGSASTWGFAIGSGSDAETLIISGANGTAPTLGTAKTVATGSLTDGTAGDGKPRIVSDVEFFGANAITALGTPTTAACLTGVKVTTQPTVALSTGATAGTGVVSVATGITSATTTTNNKDEVTVAKYGDLGVSVS